MRRQSRGLRLEQIALRAEARLGGGDDFLADAVDRRIGDLREQLLEVVVEQLRLVREHGERRVVAHRADGFDAVAAPSARAACADLRTCSRRRSGAAAACRDPAPALPAPPADPSRCTRCSSSHCAIRTLAGDLALDLLVVDDAALLGVDEEHAARLQAALAARTSSGGNVEHAGFGGHDHQVVLGDVVARGAQAVAIEHRADLLAVGEGDRGRAVPRLHQAGVIFVERPLRVVHALVVRPRLRNHHHHRVRQRAAGQHQQFERVVEHRRVAAVRVDDRQDLLDVVAEQRRTRTAPRGHASS